MAANHCHEGLQQFPGDANLLCLSARARIALREFSEASAQLQEAIRMFPEFSMAHEALGDLMLVQGKPDTAQKAYEQAMRLDPTRLVTHEKIAKAKELTVQLEQGAKDRRRNKAGRRVMPFEGEIAKALEHERNGQPEPAEDIYRQILTRDPDHIEAARLLARIAFKNKRFGDAEIFLQRVLKNASDYTRAWADMSNVQRELGQLDASVESAERVVELSPDQPESHVLYASAVGMIGEHDKSIAACKRALEIAPDKAGPLCTLGHHQKTVGLQDDAIASYRRCIAVQPAHAEAYWSLANLKTFRFADAEVSAMESLLDNEDLPDESYCQIQNALGLEYEGRKDYQRAFEKFAACNVVRRKLETYDPVDTEGNYDRIIEMFDAEFMRKHAGIDAAAITPIFIVGLPRSGSTLIEQILASHSQVDATHELSELSRVVQSRHRQSKTRERFPDTLSGLSRDDWAAIGQEYLDRTAVYRGNAPFFVDKNPNNFMFVGFLKIAIPNAKIVDARRHPLDSCFGSYKQLFASGQPFSYDLVELGEYYLQYRRLVEHWQQVAPGFVLDVQYESVVANLESEVRRLLEYCGLPFEDACLRFHETERAVKTASSEQVRRPIYSSSVNLWRKYEDNLETLIQILEPRLKILPEADQPKVSA